MTTITSPVVAPEDQDEVYRAMTRHEPTNWDDFRKCSTVCGAETGEPCFTTSSSIANGRPDGIKHILDGPHNARKRRTGR